MYIPDSVEDIERVVELGLLWIVLDSEEAGVTEVDPSDDSQTKDAITRWALIDIQHQTRVKELFTTNMVTHRFTVYNIHAYVLLCNETNTKVCCKFTQLPVAFWTRKGP